MFPTRIPVVWHLNHSSALPWHKVTSDGSLVLLHVDLSAQGNYSCYDNHGLLLHSVKLRLGRKCCCDLFRLTAPNLGVITLNSSAIFLVSRHGTAALKEKLLAVGCLLIYPLHKAREHPSPSHFSCFFG